MPNDPTPIERQNIDIQKEAIKEVLREWMDDQFTLFGKWTLRGLMVIIFSVFIHILLASHNLLALEHALRDAAGVAGD